MAGRRITAGGLVASSLAAVALASCGGPSKPTPTPAPLPTGTAGTSTTTAPAVGHLTPTTLGGLFGKAERQACLADAATVQQAADEYRVLHGQPAASIEALIRDGVLRTAPSTTHGYVIGYQPATGKVTASGICTLP